MIDTVSSTLAANNSTTTNTIRRAWTSGDARALTYRIESRGDL